MKKTTKTKKPAPKEIERPKSCAECARFEVFSDNPHMGACDEFAAAGFHSDTVVCQNPCVGIKGTPRAKLGPMPEDMKEKPKKEEPAKYELDHGHKGKPKNFSRFNSFDEAWEGYLKEKPPVGFVHWLYEEVE